MIFVDSNIFVYAKVLPKGELTDTVRAMKDNSKRIVARISSGEKVATSVVHLSEVANLIKSKSSLPESTAYVSDIIRKANVEVLPVTKTDYSLACSLAKDKSVDVNDALAILLMESAGITEIYTYNIKHFKVFNKVCIRTA